ncbi:hypothetical protein ACFSTC_33195 [Nonomuraea ferruginea]
MVSSSVTPACWTAGGGAGTGVAGAALGEAAQLGEPGAGARGQHGDRAGQPDRDAAAARHLDGLRLQVDDERGVLVDAEHGGARRQLALHPRQPPLPQVAVAGVVGAALGVVEMGGISTACSPSGSSRSMPSRQQGSAPTL